MQPPPEQTSFKVHSSPSSQSALLFSATHSPGIPLATRIVQVSRDATFHHMLGGPDYAAAVIRERGPLSAAELATAIGERGRYVAPRSTKPLDAATVNSRVSNPAYRGRFTRSDGRIGLADAG